eukprot:GHRR01013688.1.p1 GENE.GHRR01013688.1~~GHRR01013688.1.p1  ORF type:complete len:421 (+),score=166.22 GHRR01013688.1:1285-2547(+)
MCCMLQQLEAIHNGDGYLCRCQEADLKYMIAFEEPHRALQWCLAVQEALMYVDWPEHILSHPGFEEVLNPETGLPTFRGPRLRMGLAAGQPTSVLPDHAGRANYYGGSVNRAARFMDAAAHGGQLVTDLQLLHKLFNTWVAGEDDDAATITSSMTANEVVSAGAISLQAKQHNSAPLPTPSPIATGLLPFLGRVGACHHRVSADQLDVSLLVSALRSRSESHARVAQRHRVSFSFDSDTAARRRQQIADMLHKPESDASSAAATPAAAAAQQPGSGTGAAAASPFTLQSVVVDVPASNLQDAGSSLPTISTTASFLLGNDNASAAAAEPTGEPVTAYHLGTFSFKGSGTYEMGHALHASLAAHTFPCDPPKGKGERVVVFSGPVQGLHAAVLLQVPARLAAARKAFLQQRQQQRPAADAV